MKKDWWTTYKRIPNSVKASVWFTICSCLQKGIQFITVPLFTRILSTQQYGQFSLYQSWATILTIFATLNLFAGVFNNGMLKFEYDKKRYITSMQGLSTTVTVSLFLLYLIFSRWVDNVIGLPHIVVLTMFLEVLFTPSLQYWMMQQRFEYRYKMLVAVTLGIAILNPLISLVSVSVAEAKGIARIVSVCFVNASAGLMFYVYNIVNSHSFFVKKYWKYALAFNLPLIPHYLAQVVLGQSDRIMIKWFYGESAVAIYSIAYSIGMVMSIISGSINASFIPWTYKACKRGDFDTIEKTTTFILCGVAIMTLIPVLSAPEIIGIMGPSEYAQSVWVIAPVAMAHYFIFLYSLFGNIEFYYERSKLIMVASCIAAAMNLLLNWLFMPIFGYIAAAYTTVVCYILLAIVHYCFMRVILREQGVESRIYSIKMILFVTGVLALSVFVSSMLYPYPWIRYGAILLTGLLIIFCRRKILRFWEHLKSE